MTQPEDARPPADLPDWKMMGLPHDWDEECMALDCPLCCHLFVDEEDQDLV